MSGPEKGRIAKNIKVFRLQRRMSQDVLSCLVGVPLNTVTTWEQQRRSPNIVSLARIARALGRPVDDFMLEDPPPPSPHWVRPAFAVRVIDKYHDDDLYVRALAAIDEINREHIDRAEKTKKAPPAVPLTELGIPVRGAVREDVASLVAAGTIEASRIADSQAPSTSGPRTRGRGGRPRGSSPHTKARQR